MVASVGVQMHVICIQIYVCLYVWLNTSVEHILLIWSRTLTK